MKNMPGWFKAAMADGGAVKRRDDGGRVSADSKAKAAALRAEADKDQRQSTSQIAKDTATTVIGTGISALSRGRLGRFVGRAGELAGSIGLAAEPINMYERHRKRREADSIERGEPVPGQEDRKSGGRVGRKDGGKSWISGAIKKPGALHKSLGVPEGEKIPAKKLDKAAHSSNQTLRRRAVLAKTLKGFGK